MVGVGRVISEGLSPQVRHDPSRLFEKNLWTGDVPGFRGVGLVDVEMRSSTHHFHELQSNPSHLDLVVISPFLSHFPTKAARVGTAHSHYQRRRPDPRVWNLQPLPFPGNQAAETTLTSDGDESFTGGGSKHETEIHYSTGYPADLDRELTILLDELLGPVDGVEKPASRRISAGIAGDAVLLAENQILGKFGAKSVNDQTVRDLVRHGHRFDTALETDLEFTLVDLEDFPGSVFRHPEDEGRLEARRIRKGWRLFQADADFSLLPRRWIQLKRSSRSPYWIPRRVSYIFLLMGPTSRFPTT